MDGNFNVNVNLLGVNLAQTQVLFSIFSPAANPTLLSVCFVAVCNRILKTSNTGEKCVRRSVKLFLMYTSDL